MLDTLDVDIDLLKKDLANGIGKGPWSKSLNGIFPIKYVIPSSLSSLARTAESEYIISFFCIAENQP